MSEDILVRVQSRLLIRVADGFGEHPGTWRLFGSEYRHAAPMARRVYRDLRKAGTATYDARCAVVQLLISFAPEMKDARS